jgi:hypothetical protein
MGSRIWNEIISRLTPAVRSGSLPAHADAAVRSEVAALLRRSLRARARAADSSVEKGAVADSGTLREEEAFIAAVTSGIPNAGLGVVAKRGLTRGQVLTLYPGRYFPPLPDIMTLSTEWVESAELVSLVKPTSGNREDDHDDEYLINSIYGGFLSEPNACSQGLTREESAAWLGHRIQHPPKRVLPNVDLAHFRWLDILQCTLPAPVPANYSQEEVDAERKSDDRRGTSRAFSSASAGASSGSGGALSADLLRAALRGTSMHTGTHYVDYRHTLPPPPSTGSSTSTSTSTGSAYSAAEVLPRAVMLPSLSGDELTYWRRMNGIAVVANRDVAPGEELFLDYAFSEDKARRLHWYHPVG